MMEYWKNGKLGPKAEKPLYQYSIIDGLVKSLKSIAFVIPAKAGIQLFRLVLDSRFRGSDVITYFLRIHHYVDIPIREKPLYPKPFLWRIEIPMFDIGKRLFNP
jgi:hypothetical protein